MNEKIFLAEYEIESHACLAEGLEKVNLCHPNGDFSVELRNKRVDPGEENPLLTAYITLKAESLEDANEKSKIFIKIYADLLTFSTNIRFRVGRLLKVADWTPGLIKRECFIYHNFPGYDRPYPLIEQTILDSIESLLKANITPLFRRVLRWFSKGVSARYIDDQFQYFWFVLELLSQVYKESGKVNDLCPKCRKPLYCESCDEHPLHRPYPKQAIKQLFSKMVQGNSDAIFSILNDIRNALMHGDDITTIESDLNIKFSEYVDKLGQIAWTSILNTFMNSFKEPQELELNLAQVSSYCPMMLTTNLHILFYSKDANNPRIEEIPNVKVGMSYKEKTDESNKSNPADRLRSG